MIELLAIILSISAWLTPQPQHSAGLLVIYGDDHLVRANADWHSYSLDGYAFGLSSISPAHLGRIAWVRSPGGRWLGPGLVVDVVARIHAYESIYLRQEVAEVSRATAAQLGYTNGGRMGEVFFGACPPDFDSVPEPYVPPLSWDYAPTDHTPSLFPYPAQQAPQSCALDERFMEAR